MKCPECGSNKWHKEPERGGFIDIACKVCDYQSCEPEHVFRKRKSTGIIKVRRPKKISIIDTILDDVL